MGNRFFNPPDDVKEYRSQAEYIRVHQTWILILIATSSWLTNLLVALKVFNVI